MSQVVGGEVVAAMLAKEGVDTVFGIIDGTYLGFFAAFEKYGIKFISPRHETCAVHMAAAYARQSGKLGVAMASNGPGVANVLPGVVVENAEGNRVMLITSSRRPQIAYPDRGGAFQYFPQTEVTAPISKWSGHVPSTDRLQEFMHRGFREAYHGRPGVVHVDVPENIMNTPFEFDLDTLRQPHQYRRTKPIAAAAADVKEAADMLRTEKIAVIHAGSGIVHAAAYEELQEVAELLSAPVTTSWAARGCLPETHPLSIPMIYLDTSKAAHNDADLVLILGSRVGETDFWGKAPYWRKPDQQKAIQVDLDDSNIGANKPVNLSIVSCVKSFLRDLAAELKANPPSKEILEARKVKASAYCEETKEARSDLDEALNNDTVPMHTSHAGNACQKFFDGNAIVVSDGGNTSVWANYYTKATKPNSILSTFKFGMLGAGVSQAIGAKAANPDKPVYCIIGDGAMGFHIQEIETSVRTNLPVIYLVLCDKQWGMVKLTQQFALGDICGAMGVESQEPINADFHEIQFDKVAEAMGAFGARVSDPKELEPTLKKAVDSGKCAVIHVDVDPMLHLWAPALQEFKEMHQEPAG